MPQDNDIIIGKDVLELLSGAMYADPRCIFREYVQNAVDSIEEAEVQGLFTDNLKPKIEIYQDPLTRCVTIRDNGTAIKKSIFKRRLTSFGASQKRGTDARGFRGVGRLAGLGYCRELVFRSRTQGSETVSELRWDCIELKRLLNDHECTDNLREVVSKIISVNHEIKPKEDDPERFFEVEMVKAIRLGNDLLLNEQILENYLSQVAPVPFHPDFKFGKEINESLAKHGLGKHFDIFLQGRTSEPVYRLERDEHQLSETSNTRFTSIWHIEIPSVDDGIAAVGWILHSEYIGAFPKGSGVGGIRIRAGNIQIGDEKILEHAFPESRFNLWTVGEFHITSKKLIPNGRRDDLEHNLHYDNLKSVAKTYLSELSQILRKTSGHRNLLKESKLVRESVQEKWQSLRNFGYSSSIHDSLLEKLKKSKGKLEFIMNEDGDSSIYSSKIMHEKSTVEKMLNEIGNGKNKIEEIDYSKFNFSTEELVNVVLENCEPKISRMILELLQSKSSA